jgi:2',3'-cyclic-nucleotide 2'-phosphodiesterase (5'-nucleotidase family)
MFIKKYIIPQQLNNTKFMKNFLFLLPLIFILSCGTAVRKTAYGLADGKVEWIFLHVNDVYEIAPLSGGKIGGLARIATLRRELMKENPNVITVMAGDFLNPSLIGTLKYEGSGIKGRQMVDVMNAVGFDYVCFGNHEFDLDFVDLQKRIDESNFTWLSSNAFKVEGEGIVAFGKSQNPDENYIPEYKIITLKDGTANEMVKVGMWGVVLDASKKDYVQYSDIFERSNSINEDVLKKESDVQVGLTHVMIENDKEIAQKNPDVSLIMGGHEHNNQIYKIGKTVVAKADANAVTAYVHRCSYDLKTKKTTVTSELVKIDEKIIEDPTVATVVKKWTDIADAAFKKAGFAPNEPVANLKEALDGRSSSIRLQQNNLGDAITRAMAAAASKPVDCAFMNSGSVRIDDMVQGTVTQADIVRILPYGGKLIEMDIKGSELKKVLLAGLLTKGRGGYLQWYNISYSDADKLLKINGKNLSDEANYHIITNDFLFSGGENNFEFFKEGNPNVTNIIKPNSGDTKDLRNDIRMALIAYLKSK